MTNIPGLLSNPLFNMGLGLLAERGQPSGLLAGLQLAQQSNYQNALINNMRRKQELAQKQDQRIDDQQTALMRLARSHGSTQIPGSGPLNSNPQPAHQLNPEYEDMALGAPQIFQKMMEARMVPSKPKVTDDMAEYMYGQKDPAFMQHLIDMEKAGANKTSITNTVGGQQLTPGQKKLDELYAQQFADFGPGGQFADSAKMIRQINEARAC